MKQREKERGLVYRLNQHGFTNDDISETLFMSVEKVEKYLKEIAIMKERLPEKYEAIDKEYGKDTEIGVISFPY